MNKFNKQEFFKLTQTFNNNIKKLNKIIELKERLELELSKQNSKEDILEKINILDKNFEILYNENVNIKKLLK